MTIQEIESACDASQTLDFTRHQLEGPELSLRKMFYPFGFPAEVRTNSQEILCLFNQSWGCLEKRFNTHPIEVQVLVTEAESTECPPAPCYRIMRPLLISTADARNYSIYDLNRNRTTISVSSATLRHKRYLRYFFLDAAAGAHIATRYATPVMLGVSRWTVVECCCAATRVPVNPHCHMRAPALVGRILLTTAASCYMGPKLEQSSVTAARSFATVSCRTLP